MLSSVVQDAINRQVNSELTGSYTYLSMSAWCSLQQFHGCAHWLRLQSQEEYGHAMKLLDFLLARNGTVKLEAVAAPPRTFKSLPEVFELSLKQEQDVTAQIDTKK